MVDEVGGLWLIGRSGWCVLYLCGWIIFVFFFGGVDYDEEINDLIGGVRWGWDCWIVGVLKWIGVFWGRGELMGGVDYCLFFIGGFVGKWWGE